jgi:hypothetical protein
METRKLGKIGKQMSKAPINRDAENGIGTVAVELTSDDLREIDGAAAQITVQGGSLPRKAGAADRSLSATRVRPTQRSSNETE